MDRFFESIDITAQLRNALRAVRSIPNGIPSLLLALIFGLSCYVLWPWIWFLDLDSTRVFGEAKAAIVAGAGVPFFDPAAFGWSLLGGLLLFTLIELGSPVLARYGVAPAAWLLWAAICIDAYTDYPRVQALMEPNRAWFVAEAGGFWGTGLFWLARAALLFVATIGLELAFVVLAVCAVALLLKTFMGGPRRAAVATGD
ncbi:hypothetical protein K2Z83_27640 [Oscillochloris sp. ZM17-4]|uniref:hypothetical protein n=1 Tax=Oscillochloris sp. ZM17-4 TaxID=2866714 RepID=UPI001C731ECE|nr:hypothetical protein [Oscillochloris sp. ZM17-4]MBX0331430.1 hypothetical protein [Oscillochloris sp. ZM17-4]